MTTKLLHSPNTRQCTQADSLTRPTNTHPQGHTCNRIKHQQPPVLPEKKPLNHPQHRQHRQLPRQQTQISPNPPPQPAPPTTPPSSPSSTTTPPPTSSRVTKPASPSADTPCRPSRPSAHTCTSRRRGRHPSRRAHGSRTPTRWFFLKKKKKSPST